jgi:alpha-ketoglutarate-dependent taurine dioxygenase
MEALVTLRRLAFRGRACLPRLQAQRRCISTKYHTALDKDRNTEEPEPNPGVRRVVRPNRGQLLTRGLLSPQGDDDPSHLAADPIQLRLHCNCALCVDPSDGQKNYSLAHIPEDIAIRSYEVDGTKQVVTWTNDVPGFGDDHVSIYTKGQISGTIKHGGLPGRSILRRPQRLWDRDTFDIASHSMSWSFYMDRDEGLAMALHHLWEKGLVFIENVPAEEKSVKMLAERIALLRNTFYQPTWDVRSKPSAENVAYTSRYLGYHMDLLYMKEPPGLQLLHCIQNTCEGGESFFADTFAALWRMERESSDLANALDTVYVPYGYRNGPNTYYDRKPVVHKRRYAFDQRYKLDQHGHLLDRKSITSKVNRVYWSPPFVQMDTMLRPGTRAELREQQRALKKFADVLEDDSLRVETKLPPGTCVIFDNLRVVHARKAFDTNSGHRWLKGAYLDSQDFISKAQSLISHMPNEGHRRFAGQKRLELE